MAVFQVNMMAETLGRTVPVMVILPTDKVYLPGMPRREEGKPFKTLYLLHGIVGDYTDWIYGTRIKRLAEERDLCVVMPSGDNAMYLDQPWMGNEYSRYVGEELVNFTRKTFPLSHKKEDTFIGGLSMGGYGALYNGMRFHETFSRVVALSSALVVDETLPVPVEKPLFPSDRIEWKQSIYGADLEAVVHSEKNPYVMVEKKLAEGVKLPDIYMACGKEDFLLERNDRFAEFLKSKGVPVTYDLGEGSHEWDFWDRYIEKALDWLPLEDAVAGRSSGNVGLEDSF